jgi:hypothetical protein
MVGASPAEILAMKPAGWEVLPLNKIGLNGFKLVSPATGGTAAGGKGFVRYVEGAPGVTNPDTGELDPIHNGGPYDEVGLGGLQYFAAAEGNAVLETDSPGYVIVQAGSPGNIDLTPDGDGGDDGGGGE